MKLKLKYLFSISGHVFLCLLILKFFKFNRFIRGFFGDLIFMVLIFYIFKLFLNLKNKTLLFATLIFAYTVEFLQYFKFINILGLENNYYAKINVFFIWTHNCIICSCDDYWTSRNIFLWWRKRRLHKSCLLFLCFLKIWVH